MVTGPPARSGPGSWTVRRRSRARHAAAVVGLLGAGLLTGCGGTYDAGDEAAVTRVVDALLADAVSAGPVPGPENGIGLDGPAEGAFGTAVVPASPDAVVGRFTAAAAAEGWDDPVCAEVTPEEADRAAGVRTSRRGGDTAVLCNVTRQGEPYGYLAVTGGGTAPDTSLSYSLGPDGGRLPTPGEG